MKRLADIFCSALGIIMFSPIIFVVAIFVWITSGLPVFFAQQRPGLNGKPFYLLKFKSMNNACDKNGDLLPGKDRLTKFGKFIRSTSLDELPQLFNVLKGDMSLVGPRPLLMDYLQLYSPEEMRRHEVKPGVTGWAQINGRNTLSWEESFKLDVWYVDNHSWRLDLKILWLTFVKVLRREGVNTSGDSLRPVFKGSEKQ